MLPFRTRLDPEGYYLRLGLEPSATRADIVTAFRTRALMLHPDVPRTGNAAAFLALKQAYDVLSNQERRAAYDRDAKDAALNATVSNLIVTRPPPFTVEALPVPKKRRFHIVAVLWVGLGGFLCLCLYQAVAHLLSPSPVVPDGIRPNAAIVAPLSPSAHRAVLYGPEPVRLPGVPNFFVSPSADPVMVWSSNSERNTLVPLRQLPSFSMVQAVRMIRQTGMLEILVDENGDGFIAANRLTPGSAEAARTAYCEYNAGPAPTDGETLERRGKGHGALEVENRALQPAVVKLRDDAGLVVLAVFLEPSGHVVLEGLPEGIYRTEFAIGELWSRACNSFAAGMRARRMNTPLNLVGASSLVVASDAVQSRADEIPDQAFEKK